MPYTTSRPQPQITPHLMAYPCSKPVPELAGLLQRAVPFLRILGIDSSTRWKGKKREGDARNGPWYGSVHEVLDARVWETRAECLYFLVDGQGRVRYIGETKNRIADRWRTPPAACAVTGRDLGNPFVFHNRAWAPMEAEFGHFGHGIRQFEVSVLLGKELSRAVQETGILAYLPPRNPDTHLAKQVERWLCAQPVLQHTLWNVAGTGRRNR